MSELAPGSVVSGHRIEGAVGRGGMGVVYRATQLALGRVVALKVIAPELLDDASTRERFLREARAAASIEHPHVIPVLHAGDEDGVTFLVMRYVDGDDVRTLVRRGGPLDPERAAGITAQVGDALDAIHRAGLVHRDVKPANVLLGRGDHVFVSDFGLAKQALSGAGETRSGQWVGTLDFVAPEQIRGERVDARTDVYALGGLLYYMLAGHSPFSDHDGDEAKLWAHLTEAPPSASSVRPELASAFDVVIARAMAKDPADRYPSAGDVGRAALAAALGADPAEAERTVAVGAAAPRSATAPAPDAPTTDAPVPDSTEGGRVPRRTWLVAGAAALVAALAVGVAALLGAFGGSSRDPGRPSGVRVGPTVANVGRRPNGVVVAGGTVWVSSAGLDRLTGLEARTGRRLAAAPVVGRTVVAMAFTGSEVWVALDRPARLVRLDRSGARIGDELPLPRTPIGIDATRDAVWVAVAGRPGVRDSVLRYEPGTGRRVGRIAPADGVRAIAAGPDGVWIAHQGLPTVAHVDASGNETVRAFLRQPAYDLTYGAGYVWASLRTDDTVARIAPDTGDVVQIAAPQRPMQLSVAGGRVFVPGYIDNAVGVIDPRTARPVGRPLPVGLNPFASASDATHVWVTSVANNSVTRFDVL